MLYPRPFQNDDDSDQRLDRNEFPSPEFEALAEQLADDARMLAERYPAPTPAALVSAEVAVNHHPAVEPGPGRWFGWRKIAAASVLVAAAMGIWLGSRRGDDRGQIAVDIRHEQQGIPAVNEAVDRSPSVSRQTLPAISFQEFTGPEQEAVLDLLEENALSQGSLSI